MLPTLRVCRKWNKRQAMIYGSDSVILNIWWLTLAVEHTLFSFFMWAWIIQLYAWSVFQKCNGYIETVAYVYTIWILKMHSKISRKKDRNCCCCRVCCYSNKNILCNTSPVLWGIILQGFFSPDRWPYFFTTNSIRALISALVNHPVASSLLDPLRDNSRENYHHDAFLMPICQYFLHEI